MALFAIVDAIGERNMPHNARSKSNSFALSRCAFSNMGCKTATDVPTDGVLDS